MVATCKLGPAQHDFPFKSYGVRDDQVTIMNRLFMVFLMLPLLASCSSGVPVQSKHGVALVNREYDLRREGETLVLTMRGIVRNNTTRTAHRISGEVALEAAGIPLAVHNFDIIDELYPQQSREFEIVKTVKFSAYPDNIQSKIWFFLKKPTPA